MNAEQIHQDLADVARQLADGEIDEATASRLVATYEEELAATDAPTIVDSPTRKPTRMMAGAALLVLSFVGITWAASGSLVDREADAFDAPDRQVDLASVSNEQMIAVIEANPDIPQVNRMRLALAERYFEDRQFSDALVWFQAVLEAEPTAGEESEALGRIGWMVLESGDPENALAALDRALALNPANVEANFFRGLLHARLGNVDSALADLRTVAAAPDVPEDILRQVQEAIAIVESES